MDRGVISIKFDDLYRTIEEKLPKGREKSLVLTKLDEAIMWFERVDWYEPDGKVEETNTEGED